MAPILYFCPKCDRRSYRASVCELCGLSMVELFGAGGNGSGDLENQDPGDPGKPPMRRRDVGAVIGAAVGQGNPAAVFLGYSIGRALEGKPIIQMTPEPDPGPGRDLGKDAVRGIGNASKLFAGGTRRLFTRVRDKLRSVRRRSVAKESKEET